MKPRECAHYRDCAYHKGTKTCPESCNRFKHRDEVTVVRCKNCKLWLTLKCRMNLQSVSPEEEDYCSFGERKNKST